MGKLAVKKRMTIAALSKETVAKFILKTIATLVVSAIVVTIGATIATTVSAIVDPPRKYNIMEAGLGYKIGDEIRGNGTEELRTGYIVTTVDDIGIKQQQLRSYPVERIELYHTPGAGLCRVRAFVENVSSYNYAEILGRFTNEYPNPSAVSDTPRSAVWIGDSLEGRDLFYMSLRFTEDSEELSILYVFDNLCECIGEIKMDKQIDLKDPLEPVLCSFDAEHITEVRSSLPS